MISYIILTSKDDHNQTHGATIASLMVGVEEEASSFSFVIVLFYD
jgi:hypothetical protein